MPNIQNEQLTDSRDELRAEIRQLKQALITQQKGLEQITKRFESIEKALQEDDSTHIEQPAESPRMTSTPVAHPVEQEARTKPPAPLPVNPVASGNDEGARESRRKRRRRSKTKKNLISGYLVVIGIFLALAFGLVIKNLFNPMFHSNDGVDIEVIDDSQSRF